MIKNNVIITIQITGRIFVFDIEFTLLVACGNNSKNILKIYIN